MSHEIRISVVVHLPDDLAKQAAQTKAIFAAWESFTEATKGVSATLNDFTIGPAKPEPPRRKRGRPRLVTTEPTSAA